MVIDIEYQIFSSLKKLTGIQKYFNNLKMNVNYSKPLPTYLEGVILVKSFPIVSITRLPQIHNPNEIPIPPNNSK